MAARVVRAPSVRPSVVSVMPAASSGRCFTSTSRWGWATSAFISGSRSVPPASGRAEPSPPSSPSASSNAVVEAYSNARMQGLQQSLAVDRRLADADPNRVEDGVRNSRGGRNQRRLTNPLGAGWICDCVRDAVRGMLDRRDVGQRGHLVELEVRVQHDAGARVEHALFEQPEADALRNRADDLTIDQGGIDDAPAIVGGHDAHYPDVSCLDIDFDFDALRAERTDGFVLRVRAARTLALNHVRIDAAGDLLHAQTLADALQVDIAVADPQIGGLALEQGGGCLEQLRLYLRGGDPDGRADRRLGRAARADRCVRADAGVAQVESHALHG